jgi:hypothetical protein
MNVRLLSATLMLFAAIVFLVVGMRTVPRNNTYVILGAAFAILAAVRFRRARAK